MRLLMILILLFVRVPTHSSQIQMQDESTNFVLQGEAAGRALLNL